LDQSIDTLLGHDSIEFRSLGDEQADALDLDVRTFGPCAVFTTMKSSSTGSSLGWSISALTTVPSEPGLLPLTAKVSPE
jgi:hypothetical protein